jgi:hypothetical protein
VKKRTKEFMTSLFNEFQRRQLLQPQDDSEIEGQPAAGPATAFTIPLASCVSDVKRSVAS